MCDPGAGTLYLSSSVADQAGSLVTLHYECIAGAAGLQPAEPSANYCNLVQLSVMQADLFIETGSSHKRTNARKPLTVFHSTVDASKAFHVTANHIKENC